MRTDVFICYSHKDEKWRKKVQTALKPYFRDTLVVVWDDKRIRIGTNWEQEISKALAQAKIAVLLVSMDFLESDYIYEKELPEIFRAAKSEGLQIFWIAIEPSAVKDMPSISNLQCAHEEPAKPLSRRSASNQKQALVDIASKIAAEFK